MSERRRARREEMQDRVKNAIGNDVPSLESSLPREVTDASIPLLAAAPDGNGLEALGSGVLLRSQGKVVIFTALHVLAALRGKDLVVPVRGGKLVQVGGYANGSTKMDVAIFDIRNPDLAPFRDIALPGGVVFQQSEILDGRRLLLHGYLHAASRFSLPS